MATLDDIVAIIALKEFKPIDLKAFSSALAATNPEPNTSLETLADQSSGFDLAIDGTTLTVRQFSFPIPLKVRRGIVGLDELPPNVKQSLIGSRAHVVVSAPTPKHDPAAVRIIALRVTIVTALLAEKLPATGVLWANASHVLAPDYFCAEALAGVKKAINAGEDGSLFELWIAVQLFAGQKDNEIIARTIGLAPFIEREFECGPYARSREELKQIVRGSATHALQRGQVLSEGLTVALAGDEIGRIALEQTAVPNESLEVYRIVLSRKATGRKYKEVKNAEYYMLDDQRGDAQCLYHRCRQYDEDPSGSEALRLAHHARWKAMDPTWDIECRRPSPTWQAGDYKFSLPPELAPRYAAFKTNMPEEIPHYDFVYAYAYDPMSGIYRNLIKIVSKDWKDAIEMFEPGVHEFFPFELRFKDKLDATHFMFRERQYAQLVDPHGSDVNIPPWATD